MSLLCPVDQYGPVPAFLERMAEVNWVTVISHTKLIWLESNASIRKMQSVSSMEEPKKVRREKSDD